MRRVFDTPGDQLYCNNNSECRKKTVHGVGYVAKAKWVDYGDHLYTGIFKGGDSGIIRFSTGNPPGSTLNPSIALKFLRDGVDSANFVATNSLYNS